MNVTVVAPDPTWADKFAKEEALICSALKEVDAKIHHIGSTAIRGIYAKPIIDMLLTVPNINIIDTKAKALESIGYANMGEFGIPGRRYFRKANSDGVRTHHLHAFSNGSLAARRHIAFRDYMNAHFEAAREYSLIKQRLAEAHPTDIEAYMDGKEAFINHHEELALNWASRKQ